MKKKNCVEITSDKTSAGCVFNLPSRSRFVPWSWLLFAEANIEGTALELKYSHLTITIEGQSLIELLPSLHSWELREMVEGGGNVTLHEAVVKVDRIDIEENQEVR